MPKIAGWRPIHDTHAIQAAGISVQFSHPIGDVAWRRIDKDVGQAASSLGLSERQPVGLVGLPEQALALIRAAGPVPGLEQGVVHVRRVSPELIGEKLQLTRESVRYEQGEYVRWAPMRSRFKTLASDALLKFAEVSSPSSISCDYVDTFVVEDIEANNRVSDLVDQKSPAVAPMAHRDDALWHTHSGWFEYPDSFTRRLVNVFVDVEQLNSSPNKVHTLRVRTLISDQFGQTGSGPLADGIFDWDFMQSRIDAQHTGLKVLLKAILTPAAAQAISLT